MDTPADIDLRAYDFENKEPVCFADGKLKVYRVNTKQPTNYIMYALFCDGELGVFVIGILNGVDFTISATETIAEYRRRGFASALYISLINKVGLRLHSDGGQTEDGWALWQFIRKHANITIIDTIDHNTYKDDGTIPDNHLYTDSPFIGPRFKLIAESYYPPTHVCDKLVSGIWLADYQRGYVNRDYSPNGLQ